MHCEKREVKKFFWLFITFIAFLMIPPVLRGEQSYKRSERNWESQGEYVLTVKGDHISLKAKNASLKDVLEDIGRRMNIDVVAKIPREDKISIAFDMIYLEDALKRFKTSYAYISKSKEETGKITKIVVVPKGMEHMLPDRHEYDSRLQPSHVSPGYDPQPAITRPDYASPSSPGSAENAFQPTDVEDYDPQPAEVGSGKHSQPAVAGPEINPESPDVESESTPNPDLVESENNSHSAVVDAENNPESPDLESDPAPQPPDVASEYNPQPPIMEKK